MLILLICTDCVHALNTCNGPTHSTFLAFFFNDPSTTEIYTLSLHDALPIYYNFPQPFVPVKSLIPIYMSSRPPHPHAAALLRSEEHTSELQSLTNLVCRLLLEKKK